MNDKLLRVGDIVTITIPEESRSWGNNPCPDGTKAAIVGFGQIYYGRIGNFGRPPGVYANHAWVDLRMDDGEDINISSSYLKLSNAAEYARREAELTARLRDGSIAWDEETLLRELPPTPFWELDYVGSTTYQPGIYQIAGIDYAELEANRSKVPHPSYRISNGVGSGWHVSMSEDKLTLVERGPVWKHFHGKPIDFADLKQEAEFYDLLGHVEEIRNPITCTYAWTMEEAAEAIRNGIAHDFSGSPGPSTRGVDCVHIKRFRDEGLGKRVAKATLERFGQASD